ncbi:MAG TPA: STAS domain-containing protein [Terriglobales bacterium]|nr:STAS domain-containing protein [Terriglobales bacterium]
MKLHTATRNVGDVAVVDCRGRIIFGDETAELRQLVRNLIGLSPRIVLDLTQVDHIDSNGIGTLVGLHVAARNAHGVIKLVGLVANVKNVMDTTRVGTIFETYNTVEEAVASFAAPAAKAS